MKTYFAFGFAAGLLSAALGYESFTWQNWAIVGITVAVLAAKDLGA